MDLYCRNSKCEYYSRPIQGKENILKCPSCGQPLLGGSIYQDGSIDLPPAPRAEPPQPDPLLEPSAPGAKHEKPRKGSKTPTPERQSSRTSAVPRLDDPNLTRPLDGYGPGLDRKARFVLELIEHGQAYPVNFVHEVRTTPVYSKGDGAARRHLADLRTTPEGVELTPVDTHAGFFIQINTPIRLVNGSRFRIGHHVIEVRMIDPPRSLDPAPEHLEFAFAKDLAAKAELVFLRADGSDGLHFPILQRVLIGRGGPGDDRVDIPLLDSNVSRKHAAIVLDSRGLKMKNLSESDGTFVEIRRSRTLVEGDRFRLDDRLLQLVRYPRV